MELELTETEKDLVEKFDKIREKLSNSAFSDGLEGPTEERVCWISVKNRLPEIIKPYGHTASVLVTDGENMGIDMYFKADGWYEQGMYKSNPITHWMPLPELPKAD